MAVACVAVVEVVGGVAGGDEISELDVSVIGAASVVNLEARGFVNKLLSKLETFDIFFRQSQFSRCYRGI